MFAGLKQQVVNYLLSCKATSFIFAPGELNNVVDILSQCLEAVGGPNGEW